MGVCRSRCCVSRRLVETVRAPSTPRGLDSETWGSATQLASASTTASGCREKPVRYARAARSGRRRPCSQSSKGARVGGEAARELRAAEALPGDPIRGNSPGKPPKAHSSSNPLKASRKCSARLRRVDSFSKKVFAAFAAPFDCAQGRL
jgi:hypothetical protein